MSGYSNYTISQKVQACEDYIAGIKTARQICLDLGMSSKRATTIYKWVAKYKFWGEEAFVTSFCNKTYTADFRKQAVEEYISGSAFKNRSSNFIESSLSTAYAYKRTLADNARFISDTQNFNTLKKSCEHLIY